MTRPGWLCLWRRVDEHWVWSAKPFSPGQAWIDLLIRANFSDSTIKDPGKIGPIELSPGEAIVSLRGLEADWGWSRNRVLRFLKSLRSDTMIETTNETSFTRVKVLNWKKYQSADDKGGTANGTTSEATHGTRGGTRGGTTPGTHQNKGNKNGQGKEGEQGAISALGSSPLGMLVSKFEAADVAAKTDTLRTYVTAWVRRSDYTKVEQIAMDGWIAGKTVNEIQDHFWPRTNGRPQEPNRNDSNGRTKCLNCGGTKQVSGGVRDGKVMMVACRVCCHE